MKPNVLILCDWFVPGYKAGGPIRSVKNLLDNTAHHINYTIITGDHDLNTSDPYDVECFDQPILRENYKVIYTTGAKRRQIIQHEVGRNDYDFIYLNSLFSRQFAILVLWLCWRNNMLDKVVLATRGMLGAGALKIKPVKKRLFILAMKAMRIPQKITFHTTDQFESVDVKYALDDGVNIVEIGNLPASISYDSKSQRSERLSFVFASRVSPKKNIHFAIEALAGSNLLCDFHIYGEVESMEYLKLCESKSTNKIELFIHGALPPQQLHQKLKTHDYFVLPTLNENFGHAIIEALMLGLPVIVSDQTPWHDLEQFGAGWVVPLSSPSRWVEIFSKASQLSDDSYSKMSKRAIEYARQKIDIDDICRRYINLFHVQES